MRASLDHQPRGKHDHTAKHGQRIIPEAELGRQVEHYHESRTSPLNTIQASNFPDIAGFFLASPLNTVQASGFSGHCRTLLGDLKAVNGQEAFAT
jgi:hypothetical protein